MLNYKVRITTSDGETVEHDGVMGHAIGNGAVKLQVDDGTEYIYNGFKFFKTLLTDEEKEQFVKMIEDKETSAMAKIASQEKNTNDNKEGVKLEVVPKH